MSGGNVGADASDRGHDHRARERAEPDERADRDAGAVPVRRVADRHLLHEAEGSVLQQRSGRRHASAGGAYRRRQHRLLPPLRRREHRRFFVTTSYPIIDQQRGGSINGIIKSLNYLLDLAIPKDKQEGGTYIIPGHGRLCDEADVLEYRDMTTIIRDRIQDLVKKGMTLEQVKAAKPTLDYDGRYGATTGFWTTEMFIERSTRTLAARNKSALRNQM